MKRLRKFGGRTGWIIGVLLLLLIIGSTTFQWVTDYIWMDSLHFSGVFTTILGSKAMLGTAGFVIYGVVTWLTLFWIRKSYFSHFERDQLPAFLFAQKRALSGAIFIIAIFAGLIGSIIAQGVGWEPLLKMLNYEAFGETDPIFNLDISFYMFVLPFLEIVINILLGLGFFVLFIVAAAYSVFHMYRTNRSAQFHLGLTICHYWCITSWLSFTHTLSNTFDESSQCVPEQCRARFKLYRSDD